MRNIEAQLRELEERLLQGSVRRDPEAVSVLLTDDFREFGSSGRVFNKQHILAALQKELPTQLSLRDFHATVLAPDVVLVTYLATQRRDSQQSAIRSLRSSIWVFREAQWQVLFHQGTRLSEDTEMIVEDSPCQKSS